MATSYDNARRELEAIHHDMWLHAGRTEELESPGRYFLVRFAGVNLIVLRDEQAGHLDARLPARALLEPRGAPARLRPLRARAARAHRLI